MYPQTWSKLHLLESAWPPIRFTSLRLGPSQLNRLRRPKCRPAMFSAGDVNEFPSACRHLVGCTARAVEETQLEVFFVSNLALRYTVCCSPSNTHPFLTSGATALR